MWDRIDGYEILGTSIRIQCQPAEFGEEMNRLWSVFRASSAASRSLDTFSLTHDEKEGPSLYHDCVRVARPHGLTDAVRIACAELNRHVIGRYRGLSFHAGVVSCPSGAIAFPGGSGQGKSSLVAAMSSTGFGYVSDEALCVEPDTGKVTPYPKPLGLAPWSTGRLGIEAADEVMVDPQMFGSVSVEDRLELRHLVSFRRRQGPPALTPLPRSSAVTILLANSFNHYKRPAAAFEIVTRLARESKTWLLEYDDAFDAAELLADRLNS